MRLALLALAVLVAAGAHAASIGPDRPEPSSRTANTCPQRIDYSQTDYIQRPEEACCSTATNCAGSTSVSGGTLKRWLRQDVAAKGPGAIVEVGAVETTSIDTSTVVPPNNSSCFGLSVSGNDLTGANLAIYIADVQARAAALGQQPPRFFKQIRPENITREHMVAFDGSITGALKHWMLRTDRSWSTITTFLGGGGTSGGCPADSGGGCCACFCRVPTNGYTYYAADCADSYPPTTDTGCDDSSLEGQYSFQSLLQQKENNLWQNVVYSMFFRGGTPQAMYYPVAVLADMSHPDYRAWRIAYEKENMAREGTSGISVTLKDHFYWEYVSGTGWTNQEHWIDMGDGAGGHKISSSNVVNTLTEAVTTNGFDDGYSGKPEIRGTGGRCDDLAGGCNYDWNGYAYGMAKFVQEAEAAGLPVHLRAKAIGYEGCLTSWSPSEANGYDDGLNASTGCKDFYDDAATASGDCTGDHEPHVACTGVDTCFLDCNEAAMWRSIFQNASNVSLDIQGGEPDDVVTDAPPGTVSGGVGCCVTTTGGIGITYDQWHDMIAGGTPHPSWIRVVDSEDGYRVPDKLCVDTGETNPETAITP